MTHTAANEFRSASTSPRDPANPDFRLHVRRLHVRRDRTFEENIRDLGISENVYWDIIEAPLRKLDC